MLKQITFCTDLSRVPLYFSPVLQILACLYKVLQTRSRFTRLNYMVI